MELCFEEREILRGESKKSEAPLREKSSPEQGEGDRIVEIKGVRSKIG